MSATTDAVTWLASEEPNPLLPHLSEIIVGLVAFLVGLILLLPWMLMKMMAFTISIFGDLPRFAR